MLINESTKVRLGYLGTMEGKNMYETAQKNPEAIISIYKEYEADSRKEVSLNREFFKVNMDAQSYYFFARTNGIDIFVELPLVENDELFTWIDKKLGHHRTLWTKLKKGSLSFNCSYRRSDKFTSINIYWEREQIDHLVIRNSTNEDILFAINEWLEEFEGSVTRSISKEKIVNVA